MDVSDDSDEDEESITDYGSESEYDPGSEEEDYEPLEYVGSKTATRPGSYGSQFNFVYTSNKFVQRTISNSLGTTTYLCAEYTCNCGNHGSKCDGSVYVVKSKQWSPTTPVRKKVKQIYQTKLERPPMCHIVDWVILRDALSSYCIMYSLNYSTYEKFICWGNLDNLTTGRRTCNIKSNKNQKKFDDLPTKRRTTVLAYIEKMIKLYNKGTTTSGHYGAI